MSTAFLSKRRIYRNASSKSCSTDRSSWQGSRKSFHSQWEAGFPFQSGCQQPLEVGRGEIKESTEWVDIEAWGRLGEICQQYLHKGSLVYLEGRLKTDKYEDKGGETKYYTKVVALSMQMLDRKPEEEPVGAAEVEEEAPEYEA
jgi:hypothetical protein